PVCPNCHTEFDTEGEYLRLVRSSFRPLSRHVGSLQSFEDWHRIARGLPRVDEQAAFEASLEDAIQDAFIQGELTFDDKGTIWRGPAVRQSDGASGTLQISPTEITFGGLLKKDKTPLEVLASARASGDILTLKFRGSAEAVEYEVQDAELTVHLDSGERIVELDAGDLARRLEAGIATAARTPDSLTP
ncbi:MAG TPA: hypothetical protein VKT78_17145, partial [Fimbriimonadaceae bacterium]|nr:hypothetical protein [Fimbriimonadaceae bacterium]